MMNYKSRYFLFFLAMALFQTAANLVHPVTPTLIHDLALPGYMFGLMLAAMMLSNFLFSPYWGKINASLSSRRTLLICCLGYALAQLGFARSHTVGAILVMRVLAGCFVGGCFVSFLTYVINTAKPEDQAPFLTYSATIQAVCGAMGYLVGGVLGEFTILGTFYLQALVLALTGLIFRFACVPDATVTEKQALVRSLRSTNPLGVFLEGRQFLNAAFVLLFLLNILMNFGNTGFDQVFNYYMKDQLGLTSSYNGLVKSAVGIASFAVNMTLCMWVIRKANVRMYMVVMMGVCTAAAVSTLLAPELRQYIAFSILLYVGYSASLPVLQHMAARQAEPAQKNLVMGFYNATKSLGSILGSLAAGFLYDVHAKVPFAMVAVAYGLSMLLAGGYLAAGKKQSAAN